MKSPIYILHFIYVSYEITNFQQDLLFKEHSWNRRFSVSFSILSAIVFMISYFRIWNKIRRRIWKHIWKKLFQIAILYFWKRWPNFFRNVIFNQWGQLSADSIKDFFWRSTIAPWSIISYLIVNYSQNFRGSFLKVQRYPIIWFLIFSRGRLIRMFPLF